MAQASDPLIQLRRAEAELGVQIAEMQGALAGMVVQHHHIRHALAAMENAALSRNAAAESWQEFCDRVYAELIAARQIGDPSSSGESST